MNTNSNLPRTALIVGATGLVGESLLKILLKDATYTQVTALLRKKLPENQQNKQLINNPKFVQKKWSFVQMGVDFQRVSVYFDFNPPYVTSNHQSFPCILKSYKFSH